VSKNRVPLFRAVAFAPEGVKLFHAWSPSPGLLSMAFIPLSGGDLEDEDAESQSVVLSLHVEVLLWLLVGDLSSPPSEDWVFSDPPAKSRPAFCGVRRKEFVQ